MPLFFIFILTIVLMPFFTNHRPWIEKFLFFTLSFCLTPLIGIPLYWYIFRR